MLIRGALIVIQRTLYRYSFQTRNLYLIAKMTKLLFMSLFVPAFSKIGSSFNSSSINSFSGQLEKKTLEKQFANQHEFYRSPESTKIFSGHSKVDDASESGSLIIKCGEKSWRIVVKNEYFGRDIPFSSRFVRLGEDDDAPGDCTPLADFLTASELTISARLDDCGSESRVDGDWLVYSNKLVISLGSFLTLDGVLVIRRTRTVIPIECHYKRKFRVSAEPLTPTWLPMTSTIEADGLLHFSFRVIEDETGAPRQSTVYQQGEPLFLEAAVHAPLHPPLRIYVDRCVATVHSDPRSKPSYEFISNYGCLVDSLMPNSSSKFHRRQKENVLWFSIQAFHFPQDQRKQIFISCHLRATVQSSQPDFQNKACYFHGPSFSWQPTEGSSSVCLCCESADCSRNMARDVDSKYVEREAQTLLSAGPLQIVPARIQWPGQLTVGDLRLK